jgi:hypothetical protein
MENHGEAAASGCARTRRIPGATNQVEENADESAAGFGDKRNLLGDYNAGSDAGLRSGTCSHRPQRLPHQARAYRGSATASFASTSRLQNRDWSKVARR